jgi:hypothetical protein
MISLTGAIVRKLTPQTILLTATLLGATTTPAQTASLPATSQWIAAAPTSPQSPLPLFRKSFILAKPISHATLLISGLGQYEAHLNGRNITTAVLTPGWTDYRKRIFYNTYSVTALLHRGPNTLGVLLGNGFYNAQEIPGRYGKFTGTFGQPKLIAALRLTFTDGTRQTISSDATWQTAPGPITLSSVYGGEDFDARLEPSGWDTPAFNAATWLPAVPVTGPGGALQPEPIPPIQPFELHTPIAITHPRPGLTVYDLGQNFAGWPELTVTGQRGATLKLLPGELLDADGLVTQRSANAFPGSEVSFHYTLRGGPPERWHPRFSYYGFRYVQVEQTGTISALRLTGRTLHLAAQQTGTFTSSDDLLNRIHSLIDRAVDSNLFSVLTDCPHREKLGWLEQTHLAASALFYNHDLQSLYAKISDDMLDAQLSTGLVPSIAPEYPVFEGPFRDSPEWGSAVILSPWAAFQFYGDLATLRSHYASMQRYAAYLQSRLDQDPNHLLTYGLGDWYDIGPGEPGESKLTTRGLTATATYYEDLTTLARIATLLHHPDDAATYTAQAATVKQTFNTRFFHADTNQYDTGSQTANAMPLVAGLAPEDRRSAVLANLVADIHAHHDHVTAGDIGFHYVVRALTDGDRSDVLLAMLSRTDAPSYGAQLAHGATTLTEAWDANPASSQNHFMLGHAEEWFYRGLAGIDFDLSRPTPERIRIHPAAPAPLQSAQATFHSKLGLIRSAWHRQANTLTLDITVPTTSTLTLPTGFTHLRSSTGPSPHPTTAPNTFQLTSGVYHLLVVR